jgi:hypothetical protein
MHRLSTSFVLGYHGCREAVAEKLLAGDAFTPSDNAYDWLGPGVYFWESDPARGLDFIREKARRDGFDPSDSRVVGAVVDLGACLDLTTSGSMALLKVAYDDLTRLVRATGIPMPMNSRDAMRRELDCAVIDLLHAILDIAEISPVQSVKGVFTEGGPIYPGSGIPAKTHIQIAVCDPSCIKGVFRVRSRDLN